MGEGGRIMDFFKILNGGIGVSMSNFDRLWAKKYSGWPETELTGSLPLSFLSKGEALTDYRIYGTSEGAGTETSGTEPAGYKIPILCQSGVTENLVNLQDIQTVTIKDNTRWGIPFSLPAAQYTFKAFNSVTDSYIYAIIKHNDGTYSVDSYILAGNSAYTKTLTLTEGDMLYFYNAYANSTKEETIAKMTAGNIVLVSGSTAPSEYIPHRYTSNYDLFIGDSKLGEDEYVDYQEQKVYRKMNETIVANRHLDTTNGLPVAFSGRCCITSPLSVPNDYYSVYYSDTNDKNIHLMYSLFNDTTLVRRRAIENGKYMSSGYTIDCTGGNKLYLGWFDPTQVESVTPADVTNIFLTTPTDPPLPFPALSTYQGENTLSSEETVGEVTIKGRIKEAP